MGGNLKMRGENNIKKIWENRATKSHLAAMYNSKNIIFRSTINELKSIVTKWVNDHPGKVLLDIGCGDGVITAEYIDKKIYGFDISSKRIARIRKRVKGIFFVHDAEKKLKFKNNMFDIVVAVNIIEYIYNIENLIREIKRVLKSEGILIFSFPNKYIIRNFLKKDNVFFRRYSKQEIRKLLIKFNFKIIKIEKIGLGLPHILFLKNLQFLKNIIPRQYLIFANNSKCD